MKKKLVLLSSCVAASCLFADATVYELGQVEVTSSVDISQNKTTQVLSSQDIKESESKTVVDALQNIPGVFIDQTGPKNQMDVRIRGFKKSRVPVYIDGIPIYVPYNRETDLSRFTTYDISEITVSKGYVSPMYGANTIGGAINLVTKKPTKEFEGELGAGIFSGNGHEEYLTLGTNQGKFYGLLSVSNYQRDYFKLSSDYTAAAFEDGGKRENSDSKDQKLNIKIGYTPNDTDEYSFNYIMQRGEKGQPYFADIKPSFVGNNMYTRNWRWPKWDKTSYYFITKTAFSDTLSLKTRWYRDEFYNKMEDYTNVVTNILKSTSEYDDYSLGGNIQLDYKITDNQLLKFAITQKKDFHKSIDSTQPGLDTKTEGTTSSFGLEYSLQATSKLTWVVGATYDKNKVDKAQYVSGGAVLEYDKYNSDAFNPETALYYKLSDATTLFASVAKKSNMPSLADRYSTKFSTYVPNPDLKAERSINYELGVEQNFDDTHLAKIAFFFSQADDYIASVDVGGGMKQSQNIGEEEHKGFELSLDSFWTDSFSTNFSYTYIDAKVKNDPLYPYVPNIPEHSVIGSLKYSPFASLDILPQFRYESERYVDSAASNSEYKTKQFFLADLKIIYRAMKNLELAAGIKNIFDKNYFYSYGYPEEGRNYYANFRYTF